MLFWDYQKKGDPILNNYELYKKEDSKEKESKKNFYTTMAFTPDGDELLIGQTNGIIQVMDAVEGPNYGRYKKLSQPLMTSEYSNP